MVLVLRCCWAVAWVLVGGRWLLGAPGYQVEVLPSPTVPSPWIGLDGAPPMAVNASQLIAVNAIYIFKFGSDTTGALLYQNGQYSTLPIPAGMGDSSQAVAINNSGMIAGCVWDSAKLGGPYQPGGIYQPVVWGHGAVSLLANGPYGDGSPTCLNDLGQVGGAIAWDGVSSNDHAAWWDQNGILHDLGSFGGQWAQVCGINNQGQMLISVVFSGQSEVLLWDHGVTTPVTPVTSDIWGIDNRGHFLGDGYDTQGNSQCYFWNGSSAVVIPPPVPGEFDLHTNINDNDQTIIDWVAILTQSNTQYSPVLWEDGISYDLNALLEPNSGVTLDGVLSIASDGSMLGGGWDQGQWGYFLLTPDGSVPEPGSLALVGLLGMAMFVRRRK